jgi:hypothetical protein
MEVSWGEEELEPVRNGIDWNKNVYCTIEAKCERFDLKERIAVKRNKTARIQLRWPRKVRGRNMLGSVVWWHLSFKRCVLSRARLDDVTIRTSAVCLASGISRSNGNGYTLVTTSTYLGRHSSCNIQSSKGRSPWSPLLNNIWPMGTTTHHCWSCSCEKALSRSATDDQVQVVVRGYTSHGCITQNTFVLRRLTRGYYQPLILKSLCLSL